MRVYVCGRCGRVVDDIAHCAVYCEAGMVRTCDKCETHSEAMSRWETTTPARIPGMADMRTPPGPAIAKAEGGTS